MCEPATLSLIAGGLGTAVSAVGAIQQGQAASDAAKYQAGVDRNNAILANRARTDAIARGQEAELTQRRKTADAIGRQRALAASSGIEMTGSALDVLGDTAQFGEVDALTTRNNAEREAAGYAAKASNFTESSALNEMKADNATTAGAFSSLGTALSGANTVASNWYKMK